MPNLRNSNKEGFEPGSLDCESGILPLSYRAPIVLEVEPPLQIMYTLFFSDMAASFQTTTCTMYLVL